MPEEFAGEPIKPVVGTFDPAPMARGEPSFPRRFIWRDKEHTLAEIVDTWKELGPCKSGSEERYLRKHWFRIRTEDGLEMEVYFERQPRSKRQAKARWWLHTVSDAPSE